MFLQNKLKEILINKKLITEQDLENALRLQKEKGGLLSDILIKMGLLNEKVLTLALSQSLNIPILRLSRFNIDKNLIKVVPPELIKKYEILPLARLGKVLTVALGDPLNIFAIDDLKAVTGLHINPILALPSEVKENINKLFAQDTERTLEEILKKTEKPNLEFIPVQKEELSTQEVEEAPIVKYTYTLLKKAIEKRASDILIEPLEKKVKIRFRIDGVLREEELIPKNVHNFIVTRIKVMSKLNVAEHRLPQDGRFKIKINNREIDFRVSILPSSFGEKIALRVLDKSMGLLDLDSLGFEEDNLEKIKKSASMPHGMILVTGPSGSGKTTTLYAILKFVDSPEKNLITVEDPVEYQIKTATQINVNPEVGLTFASALRSILRQDPDIIMVGEIRDPETLDIAIKAALTGHLLLSTVHTTTASGAIVRLLNMGAENYLLTSCLICVIAQRLVRKLCEHCKEEKLIKREIIERLKMPCKSCEENVRVFIPKGCDKCFNTGYLGRIGICEVLSMSNEIRELILKNAQESEIRNKARSEGMRTLREDGFVKVIKGITSLDEVLRITAPD